jgi:hypothetical protein
MKKQRVNGDGAIFLTIFWTNRLLSKLEAERKANLFNLSFGFFHYENRQGLEANFVDLFEGNSQVAIFENKSTKFD